jgi:hypothetical protein
MNDNELRTAVRESVADVHSATPVAQIIGRGRAVRARRRIPVVAGALTVAAGTALAVTTLLPASHPGLPADRTALPADHPGSHPASVRLAAWTVAKQANGDIDVTINQLKDPAGLQATLRADGLPVNVTFSGRALSASCQPYAAARDVLRAVAQYNTTDDSAFLVINPSALPSGTGVAIFDEPGAGFPSPPPGTPRLSPAGPSTVPGPLAGDTGPLSPAGGPSAIPGPPAGLTGPLGVGLVYASQQCTG